MFGIGLSELLIILAIALLAIKPEKLPELASTLGKIAGDIKKGTRDIKESMRIDEVEEKRDGTGERGEKMPEAGERGEKKPGWADTSPEDDEDSGGKSS